MALPLTAALSKLLNCKPENLAEYLNNPEAVNKANAYLSGKKLKTTYQGRDSKTKVVKFGTFSLKAAAETYAFEGFLDVKVQQYFYIKHRIRLLYPQLKCIVEYHNKGHCKYYPLELLAIEEGGESELNEKPAAETDYLDYLNFRSGWQSTLY
ncbi:hypothetical protein niasHT_014851 [Heterodera trifolii]|uniref:PAZ domain-containing protein n=1 Tax=Heterodera trifolii TaxID=157864 RepID=A0ABD2L729_9BILA